MRYGKMLLGFLLLSSLAFALSSQEALDFVQSNYLSQTGETLQLFPETPILNQGNSYWVISFLRGTDVQDFVAIENKTSPKIVDAASTSQSLFEVASGLRLYAETKNNLQNQNLWFYSRVNAQYFSQLGQVSSAKKNDFQIVRSDISNAGTLNRIAIMEGLLGQIQTKSKAVADAMDATLKTESDFTTTPSTAQYAAFQSSFSLDEKLADLKKDLDNYAANVTPLSSAIANDANLDDSAKTIKIKLIALPTEFQRFGEKQSLYVSNKESLDNAFNQAANKALQSSQNVSVRIKRSLAYQELYASDNDFFTKTNKSWSNLTDAQKAITSTDYRSSWKDQTSVGKFETEYRLATDAFEKNRFDDAVAGAKKAKTLAVTIFKAGFKEEDTTPTPIDPALQNLLVTIIMAVVAIGLIIFLLPRVMAMMKPKEPNQEE